MDKRTEKQIERVPARQPNISETVFFFKETLIQLCTFQACCNASDPLCDGCAEFARKNGCVKAAWRGQAHFVSRLQAVGRHVPRLPPAGAQNTAAHATNRCLHAPL